MGEFSSRGICSCAAVLALLDAGQFVRAALAQLQAPTLRACTPDRGSALMHPTVRPNLMHRPAKPLAGHALIRLPHRLACIRTPEQQGAGKLGQAFLAVGPPARSAAATAAILHDFCSFLFWHQTGTSVRQGSEIRGLGTSASRTIPTERHPVSGDLGNFVGGE